MMRHTIGFLVTLALGLFVAPLAAHAQPPTHVHRMVYPRIVYTDVNRFICKILVPSLARRA